MDINNDAAAENARIAEALGADTIANMNYEDASIAPNAAYSSSRAAFAFAARALDAADEVAS